MAEDKRTFLQGKMNQDLDDRVLPNGEYRSAQNIQITTSEVSDIGSIQNLLGNSKIGRSMFPGIKNVETIGVFFDEKDNRIFYFVTNYTCNDSDKKGLIGGINGPTTAIQASLQPNVDNLFCGIYMYNAGSQQQQQDPILLVSGLFLNFSKTHTITGVNLIEDLLFFTDGLNQPRKINVKKAQLAPATSNNPYYTKEDKISVAKFSPFMPALLLDYDQTTLNNNVPTEASPTSSMQSNVSFPDDFIEEKFVRFSYRYRFIDGEYSVIAPFTQVCFVPKTHSFSSNKMQKILKRGQAYFQDENGDSDGMVNSINSVNLNIILPSSKLITDLDINGIEILYKESNNSVIRAVELIEIKNENASDLVTPDDGVNFEQNKGVFQYKYKSTLPYKTLPANQLPRVYDNIPLSAKAQEIVGNRVVYGNFVQDRSLPSEKGIVGLNFNTSYDAKYDITNSLGNADFNNYYLHKEYPYHSIKQKRTYEVGVVLSDKFGRQSPVLTSVIGDGSITVDAKSSTFNSSTWSENNILTIQETTPGNQDYCGDALTITFNREIPNAYGKGTLVPINRELTTTTHQFDVFRGTFWTEVLMAGGPQGGTGISQTLNYQTFQSTPLEFITGTFLYTDQNLSNVFTGYSALYMNNGTESDGIASTFEIIQINLDPSSGEILSQTTFPEFTFQSDIINITTPTVQIASAGDDNVGVINGASISTNVVNDSNGNFFEGQVVIENTSFQVFFNLGDYLKGQNTDFVQIINITTGSGNLVLHCDGEPSLSYNVQSNNVPDNYYFYTYKITPHGWYSYRVVVKQVEQDYYNVYTPGVFDFDNDRDDARTYVPILSDNINKVTRDIEFSNTQEIGLSTSKDKLFPKVIPNASNAALSLQSSNDVLDVISIGTAKEQGIKNENEKVLAFVSETSKNPLMAQIPFGGSTGNNIGSNTESGLTGRTQTLTVNTNSENSAVVATVFTSGKKVLKINGGDSTQFKLGEYLKGGSTDLVKIIKISTVSPVVFVECDGEISEDYNDLNNGENIKIYEYKYGVQDNLAVFETKPNESALDIYYETSTAGLVHELNEALAIPSIVDKLEIEPNLSEDILYWDQGVWQGQYAGIINFLDTLDNNVTSQDIIQVNLNSIRAFVETDQGVAFPSIAETIIDDPALMPFEILFSDNEWRIKPKNNFYHSVVEDNQFSAYEFDVSFIHQQTSTQTVQVDNQTFKLSLQNVAPIVEPIIDIEASIRSSSDSTSESVGQIFAFNGSVDEQNNTKGLLYFSTNVNPQQASGTINITDGDNTTSVPASTALYDNNGDLIKELEINNTTGEIFVRNEYFYGVLNKTFDVHVYDSDFNNLDSFEYNADDTGILLGRRSITTVNFTMTADLIVIDGASEDSAANHPYYLVTNVDVIQGQDIFNQDLFVGEDLDHLNCYWTENPSSITGTNTVFAGSQYSQQAMPSAPRHSSSGEYFMFSWLDGQSRNDPAQLWSIRIDEATGEPRVKKYEKQSGRPESSTSKFIYWNHIMPSSYRGRVPDEYPSFLGLFVATITMGGVIISQEKRDGGFNGDVPQNIDITGYQNTGISHSHTDGSPTLLGTTGEQTDVRDLLNSGVTQWDFEHMSNGPFSCTDSGTYGDGGFTFDFNPITGEGQGSYKYYTIGNEVSGAFCHPKDRNISDRYMYQTNQDLQILGYEYKVVYTIQRLRGPNDHQRFFVPRVFLARKGNG